MTKRSAPVLVDVDVTGYNDVTLTWSASVYYGCLTCCLADAGFYQ